MTLHPTSTGVLLQANALPLYYFPVISQILLQFSGFHLEILWNPYFIFFNVQIKISRKKYYPLLEIQLRNVFRAECIAQFGLEESWQTLIPKKSSSLKEANIHLGKIKRGKVKSLTSAGGKKKGGSRSFQPQKN